MIVERSFGDVSSGRPVRVVDGGLSVTPLDSMVGKVLILESTSAESLLVFDSSQELLEWSPGNQGVMARSRGL